MVTLLNLFLPIVSLVIALLAAIGGWSAFRMNRGQQFSTIQAQTIDALNVRVNTLEGQAESDAKEIARLRQLISTIRHALKRRGLHIEIEGEYVTLIDAEGQRTSTQPPNIAKVVTTPKPRPVKLNPIDDDDAI